MCGIIGYTGKKAAVPILLEGLAALEYRGYDSAGVAVQRNGLQTVKTRGRLALLREKLASHSELLGASCGIGHTRWATHGAPSDANSHPHGTRRVALVHNGIIENYSDVAAFLLEKGYTFTSETDTETAAKLLDYYYGEYKEPQKAIFATLAMLRGAYAFCICFADHPELLYAICKDNPLIVAATEHGGVIASDVPAILPHSKIYYRPDDGVLAVLDGTCVKFFDRDGKILEQKTEQVSWDAEHAQKGGFSHFMLKEIHEEPEAIARTVAPRLRDGLPFFDVASLDGELLTRFGGIHIVACGTAMHAGLVAKNLIERYARIPVRVEIASEFRYRDPILGKDDLVLFISQSGETADTLAALRHAKARGVYTLAIVNVVGSAVAREAESVLYTMAGPEIAVASTKAYSVQCALLYLLALRLALAHGKLTAETVRDMCQKLLVDVPKTIREVLQMSDSIRESAKALAEAEHVFYIGRGIDCELCTEASLKLKEISYIHSEAYAAGELKHGTISLVTKGTSVVSLCTVPLLAEKMNSGIREVASRGAKMLNVMTREVAEKSAPQLGKSLLLPEIDEDLALFPAICAMQLLAYHVSDLKGLDVDKPRNLAKSVTVE